MKYQFQTYKPKLRLTRAEWFLLGFSAGVVSMCVFFVALERM